PPFFIEVLSCQFRSTNDPEREEEPSLAVEARARRAFDLFHSWRTIPGTQEDGSIAVKELRQWVENARQLAEACGRLSVCDITIGELLGKSADDRKRTPNDPWPC